MYLEPKIYIRFYRIEHNNANKSDNLARETFSPPIYNFVSSSINPLTWGEFSIFNKKHGHSVPSTKAVSCFN